MGKSATGAGFNGVVTPSGFGVYQIADTEECEKSVYEAIRAGYRLIDTAAAYQNEEAVGKAIEKSGVPREDIAVSAVMRYNKILF